MSKILCTSMIEVNTAELKFIGQEIKEIDAFIKRVNDSHIKLRTKDFHRETWKSSSSSDIQKSNSLIFNMPLKNRSQRIIEMFEVDLVSFCDCSKVDLFVPFHQELKVALELVFLFLAEIEPQFFQSLVKIFRCHYIFLLSSFNALILP